MVSCVKESCIAPPLMRLFDSGKRRRIEGGKEERETNTKQIFETLNLPLKSFTKLRLRVAIASTHTQDN